ncbi:hypothetical protein Bbelb_285100 [Branchiostoma belcheri]|nr:hypothetical protein Bbelb_285100 [Branchiostoma belcheri]
MAAAPSSLGAQFSEELSCSICLELFTRPKVLPCQHTFCQDCLQNHAGRGRTFQCPNCRQQVRLPRQGVAGLPDSHIVANLCERLQNQAAVSEETREQPQPANRCSFHPSEEVRLYCKLCKVPVCHVCLDESHDEHPTMSLRKAIQQHRGPVQALITEGRGILETYCSFIRGLREKEKSLEDEKQQTDSEIEEAYRHACDQMHQKFAEEKNVCCLKLRQTTGKTKKPYRAKETQFWLMSLNCLLSVTGRSRTWLQKPTVNFTCTLGKITVTGATASSVATVVMGHHHGNQSHALAPIQSLTFGGGGLKPDCENERLQVFTLQGMFVRQFPTVLSGEEMMYPHGVALDGEGNLWVVGCTDSAEFVMQYNKQGRVLRKIYLQETEWVRAVAVDTRRNHILITQIKGLFNKQGEVLVFRPDGTLVRTVGQQQGMKYPRYITVDGEGNILVSDNDNHCVYVYNEDGQFLFKFGGEGSGEGELKSPRGICTDRAGNIIVADQVNNRVEMFDKTGRFIRHITTDMTQPWAVALAPQGQLVVTDTADNTVTIFKHSDCG